jgi:hypothetical protein
MGYPTLPANISQFSCEIFLCRLIQEREKMGRLEAVGGTVGRARGVRKGLAIIKER